ncbi:hypothetical protein T06_9842 [Trichinella sp. T6]|nr:hypothetical protein T06_9842 [Trichinella sp. T6]
MLSVRRVVNYISALQNEPRNSDTSDVEDEEVSNDIYCNAISGKSEGEESYIIIIEPFFNSCRSGQHGMQCIIHINKICLHANDALRQLKLKALPSNDTVIGMVSLISICAGDCVYSINLVVCCHQCGSKVIDKLVHLGKNSLDPDSDIQLKAT